MSIVINIVKDYSKEEKTIAIRDNGIYLIEGSSCFEKLLNEDIEYIYRVEKKLFKIIFGWKEEYVGNRKIDGERYYIAVDVNHKKKKYKIQNKFPDNWEEFIVLRDEILSLNNKG